MKSTRLLAVVLLAVLAACTENGPKRVPAVSIKLLKATPATIAPGGTTTIEWATDRAESCAGEGTLPGWTGPKAASGTLPLEIPAAGTYQARLICSDDKGRTDTKSVTVTVSASAVSITSFTATPATVVKDGSTTLSWAASNATGCEALGTLPGWSGAKATSGSQSLAQATVGDYEAQLECTGADGTTASKSVAVSVTEAPPAVTIDSFAADPSLLVVGGSTVLSWTSTGASACEAQGDLPGWTGALAADGEQTLPMPTPGVFKAKLVCTGAGGSGQAQVSVAVTLPTMNRYAMANSCFALKSLSAGKYVVASGSGYAATADAATDAEPFYLKPSALGEYLLYNKSQQLVTGAITGANGATCPPAAPGTTLCNVARADAKDSSIFVVKGAGDTTVYPVAPQYDTETTSEVVATYRNFVDPNTRYSYFTLASKPDGRRLTADAASGAISLMVPAETNGQLFFLESGLQACALFPEAQSNATGRPYKGTTADGRVVGFADTHIHVTSTTFLGGAKTGSPFHRFGVEHALADCSGTHGEHGSQDATLGVYHQDPNGHNTDGWPTLSEWPGRTAITHEALYWRWMERAWLGGLRLIVNDMVESGTLCELVRNQADPNDPDSTSKSCNEMESARKQVSTTYAMQDYIDAQYGGRGQGWWRVVWTPAEARHVIADGKMAVVIGLEVSNTFNCQLTYNPNPMRKEPYEEPADATPQDGENTYKCTKDSVTADMDQMHALGLRQLISIHEFDSAFGGNGIFGGDVLNAGNRENTGGNPTPGVPPDNPFDNADPTPEGETPTGEFWTTYNCETEAELEAQGDGYLWGSSAGDILNKPPENPPDGSDDFAIGQPFPPGCVYTGQGGRHGGTTNCYPYKVRQCNARFMTPMGLHLYQRAMETGLIIDFDHMTIDMKDQLLDLSELQIPPYPTVSTHGTYGGTTLEQARRVFRNGGHLFNGVGSSTGLINDMVEVKPLWEQAADSNHRVDVFGYGFGTDTNGFSSQASSRDPTVIERDGEVEYPFTFFGGDVFAAIPEFAALDDDGNPDTPYTGVRFDQPEEFNLDGTSARKWHPDYDVCEVDPDANCPTHPEEPGYGSGTMHGGMVTDMVQEMRLEAIAAAQRDNVPVAQRVQHLRDLYNSAEMYIQTWERTLASQAGILANPDHKAKGTEADILYAAPVSPPAPPPVTPPGP